MKKKTALLGIFIFIIHLASAQTKPDSSGIQFGEFVKEMPFGAKLYKSNYQDARDLIDNIRVLCKGKAVLIDYWATWCKPCLAVIFVQDDIIRQMWKIFQIRGGFPTYAFIDKNGNFKKDAVPLNSGTTADMLKELVK